MRGLRLAAVAVLSVALAGCGGSDGSATPDTRPAPSATASSPTAQESPTPTASTPQGGTADEPAVVAPTTDLLDWQPVPGPVDDDVTRSGEWTLTVKRNGASYSLDGPSTSTGSGSSDRRVSEALIDEDWAVVVLQDKAEERPSVAEVTELATGKAFELDGRSDVPTTTGGTWALGEGRLLHATTDEGAYCVATVDLAARTSELGWCAPKRHGFNSAHLTPGGDSLLTFDDGQPSCRTLVTLDGSTADPFEGVADCKAWDGLRTEAGAVWSVIAKENRIEDGHFYARVGEGYFDLGPGTAGSLTWCAGAAYFGRDPQREGEPATLLRWSDDGTLSVVYESPGGQAFLSAPRCGGDALTVTALAEKGDEQVTAALH